jgi:negative regulator of replication initiation
MPTWTIQIDEETDRVVRSHVASLGGSNGDVSKFIEQAVKRAVFWQTMDAVHERNRDVDPAEVEATVSLAVEEVRAARS